MSTDIATTHPKQHQLQENLQKIINDQLEIGGIDVVFEPRKQFTVHGDSYGDKHWFDGPSCGHLWRIDMMDFEWNELSRWYVDDRNGDLQEQIATTIHDRGVQLMALAAKLREREKTPTKRKAKKGGAK